VFAVVKEIRGKRKVFECAKKIFVAPSGGAGVEFGFRHRKLEKLRD